MPNSPGIDMAGLQNVLQSVVVQASGYSDGQVVWGSQNARAPNVPLNPDADYLTMKLSGPRTLVGLLKETWTYDGTQPQGQEILAKASGPTEWTLSLQAFTTDIIDDDTAQAVLANLQTQLQLTVYRQQLNAGGVCVFDFGDVLNIPRVYGAATEGRAALELRFYYRMTASYRTGYITSLSGGENPPGTPTASNGWTPPGSGPAGSVSQ